MIAQSTAQKAEPLVVSSQDSSTPLIATTRQFPIFEIIAGILCVTYALFFWRNLSEFWFNPDWATDDALQQTFPFYKAVHPQLFAGDLVTKMMECYLLPLHYAISYIITLFTQSPIMTAHWVMLIQIALTCAFIFVGIRKAAGIVPAFFATTWFLHTRLVIQRITGGLPRGWAAPVFAAYFMCALSGNMNGVLLVIIVGCAVQTPATLIVALSHGLFLLWQTARPASRAQYKPHLIRYVLLSPLFVAFAYWMVHMPSEIGSMANLEVASKMPEFHFPGGRFPFLPFSSFWEAMRTYGFDPFLSRLYHSRSLWRAWMPTIVIALLVVLVALGNFRKRVVVPAPFLCFIVASLAVYFLSRFFAFRMYVPDRHLQFPLALCAIELFSVGVWRAVSASHRFDGARVAALGCLGVLIFLGSGTGLEGSANFNWHRLRHGGAFEWIRRHTPIHAVVAGEPSFIDPIQLFGMRIGYVTTETGHPFYDRYYAEISRRLSLVLRAHYARTLKELSDTLASEQIDYFIFDRSKFTAEGLELATYFKPFDELVKNEIAKNAPTFAYTEAFTHLHERNFSAIVYRDRDAVVLDLKKLRNYLDQGNDTEKLLTP